MAWQGKPDSWQLRLTMLRKVYLVGGHITPFVGKGYPNFQKGAKGLKEQPVSQVAHMRN